MKRSKTIFFLLLFLLPVSCHSKEKEGKIWKEPTSNNKTEAPVISSDDLAKLNLAFTQLAKNLSPSVVNIYTKTRFEGVKQQEHQIRPYGGPPNDLFRFFFGNPFGPHPFEGVPRETSSLGSGVIINSNDGYIITNSHVVRQHGKNATEIMVKFFERDRGKGFEAEVVGVDETVDVALLKLKKTKENLTEAVLGSSSDLKVGEWVLAMGNPYGHTNSVTQGIISALGRDLDISHANFIQTSASINPGNSGGPLFNLKGEVIGINTAIDARAQGIGFAIPIDTAKNVVKQLVTHGEVRRGWLGIGIGDLNDEISSQLDIPVEYGVLVQSTEKSSPADKAGIKVYDVIVSVDGEKIDSAKDLSRSISSKTPGSNVKIGIYRDGTKKTIKVKLGKRPSDPQIVENDTEAEKDSEELTRKAGFSLGNLTPGNRKRYRVPYNVKNGALILHVYPGSPASWAGLSSGDIIVDINKKKVKDAGDAEKRIAKAIKGKQKIMVRVLRSSGASIVFILDLSR